MHIRLIMIFIVSSISTYGQAIDRYMIFFTDKQGSPFNITQPQEFLSDKSINRRLKLNINITEQDLPVNPDYINQVKAVGVEVFYASKWLNAVLVQANINQITNILQLNFVSHYEYVGISNPLTHGGKIDKLNETLNIEVSTSSEIQNNLIGTDQMNADGFHGKGIYIASLDAGFPGVNSTQPFQTIYPNNIIYTFNYVTNNMNVYRDHPHGTMTLSTIGANINGEFHGTATQATYLLFTTEDVHSEYRIEEYNWLFAAEKADSVGVDIITSSLGYYDFDYDGWDYAVSMLTGDQAVISKAANFATDKGIVVVTSAGNQGNNSVWNKITFPSDCYDCIAVGSVDKNGERSFSSSLGLSADGRVKPDVMALGASASFVDDLGRVGQGNGTSYSAPQIAGLIAGLMEKFPEKSPNEITSVLKNTASHYHAPNEFYGYGIPHYNAISKWFLSSSEWLSQKIHIYPTLVNNYTINLNIENPYEIPEIYFAVYNMNGQLLKQSYATVNWSNHVINIDLPYDRGVYYLKYYSSDSPVMFKKFLIN